MSEPLGKPHLKQNIRNDNIVLSANESPVIEKFAEHAEHVQQTQT